MTRPGEKTQGGLSARAWVLIGVLILVTLWTQPWSPRKKRPPTAPGAAVAASSTAAVPSRTTSPAADGWGRDPFDPRPVVSGTERTGR